MNKKTIYLNDAASLLPRRPQNAHKGTFGTTGLICGSFGMAGAAVLSAKAAIRTGVGIARMIIPKSIYNIAAVAVPEAVFKFLPETESGAFDGENLKMNSALDSATKGCNSLLIGCGCTNNISVKALVKKTVLFAKIPLIIDADGINCIAPDIEFIKQCKAETVITPHPREAARLLNTTVEEIQNDRDGAALALAKKSGAVAVLKGHGSLTATPSGELFVCPYGNSGMATAGSGDVLSGIIAALLAEGLSAKNAAVCGVTLHAAAGDIAAKEFSKTAMNAEDIAESLKALFSEIEG